MQREDLEKIGITPDRGKSFLVGNICRPPDSKNKYNQLTVMCTTRGEHRLISFRCQEECMECKLVISCRMLHNLIKIHHMVKSYEHSY